MLKEFVIAATIAAPPIVAIVAEGVGDINVPQLTATGALIALATWLLRASVAKSDQDAKAYRELLAEVMKETRGDVRAQTERLAELVEVIRTIAEEQRMIRIDLHNMFNSTTRVERMLLSAGLQRYVGSPDPAEDEKRAPVVGDPATRP